MLLALNILIFSMEQKKHKKPGAGIVLVRYFGNTPKILGLMDHDAFDLPKGSMEFGENVIQTALRETEEECGVTAPRFAWGLKHISIGGLTMFIAITDEDPVIKRNPKTNKFEHKFAKWLQFDEQYFKPKLQPVVSWARDLVNGGSFVNL